MVARLHPETGVNLTYIAQPGQPVGDAGDQYVGLDRFGRVVNQLWVTEGGTVIDDFVYGYDADGNVMYEENVVNPDFSELFHASARATAMTS